MKRERKEWKDWVAFNSRVKSEVSESSIYLLLKLIIIDNNCKTNRIAIVEVTNAAFHFLKLIWRNLTHLRCYDSLFWSKKPWSGVLLCFVILFFVLYDGTFLPCNDIPYAVRDLEYDFPRRKKKNEKRNDKCMYVMHTYIIKTKDNVSVVTSLYCVYVRRTSYTSYWYSTCSTYCSFICN